MSSELYNPGSLQANWCNVFSNSVTCDELIPENSNLPYFRAINPLKNINSNTSVTINNYSSVSGSLANQFNISTGLFTPSKSGIYLFTAKSDVTTGAPTGALFIISIYTGLNFIQETHDDNIGGLLYPTVCGLMLCTQNIPVQLAIYQNFGTPNINVSNIDFGCILLSSL